MLRDRPGEHLNKITIHEAKCLMRHTNLLMTLKCTCTVLVTVRSDH